MAEIPAGGGPFMGPYGKRRPGQRLAVQRGQHLGDARPRQQRVGPGTAIVGAFRTGATVYRRGGLKVEASNDANNQERIEEFRRESTRAAGLHRAIEALYEEMARYVETGEQDVERVAEFETG